MEGNVIKVAVAPVEIPWQEASRDIWDSKYRLKDATGKPVDADLHATFERIARALAAVEKDEKQQRHWCEKFFWALENGAIPAGRITSNAGALEHKPATSTINCTVSATVGDSMDEILSKVHEAGLTLKAGCGIGYDFSTLRPRNAFVNGAGANTSGPLSFMDIYDSMCRTVASAGGRRGAQMATFDISHPDVLEFIKVKREDGRLRQFNLSLLITDEFVEAVKQDDDWPLCFPLTEKERERDGLDLKDPSQVLWKDWPVKEDYIRNEVGEVACRIYRTIRAKQLWNVIMSSTYDFAEPGFILVDKVNEMNNNWFCEEIRATNPCGEQPLPPYGSCLLGSINLTRFVENPFTDEACFNWERFREVVTVFTRMLDNVVEINGLPLEQQRNEIFGKRRHGMGYLGLGSTISLLGMKYGDADSLAFTEEVTLQMALAGWQQALDLAREKGPAPALIEEYTVTKEMLRKRPEMAADGIKAGDLVPGRVLHSRYSRYMQQLAQKAPELVAELTEVGARFTHHSSIAPTKKSKEKIDVFSYELLAFRELVNPQAMPGSKDPDRQLPDNFITSDDIKPKQHVDIQAAAQKWIDSSISKTANVPSDFPYADFQDIYLYAYEQGLKGCTTFRYNPEAFQGVLVQEKDLAETLYRFTLDDGSVVEYRGNQEVEYDNEIHTAANLFDALKEGYYGKL
jgi:ribonucleoside-diphosphate reductase alpha chain